MRHLREMCQRQFLNVFNTFVSVQTEITCSKLIIETLEKGVQQGEHMFKNNKDISSGVFTVIFDTLFQCFYR